MNLPRDVSGGVASATADLSSGLPVDDEGFTDSWFGVVGCHAVLDGVAEGHRSPQFHLRAAASMVAGVR
jgi:hypothetical protein